MQGIYILLLVASKRVQVRKNVLMIIGANMTCFAAKHSKFGVAAVVDLICFCSIKYSLKEFLDFKNNFWRH